MSTGSMDNPGEREGHVFEGALQLPAAQRTAYVKAACEDDPALYERVLALLKAHEEGHGPLDQPALSPPQTSTVDAGPPSEKPGDRIGNYKILQQIGEGGCGVVYMAEQEQPVRRRVALKVIKMGMDTKQVIARFEAERQALALMDHPNIAQAFDAGATETGRPFFVMELVRGIKITDYCDQNKLTTVQRLQVFMQVCHAIQHAHQKGIIHRDIKPSNILVTLHDGVPVPKVIDFGIAKATALRLTDKTVFTQFEHFIGTPAYMSPEQAELSGLDIDTRSDIYSLGVLLYELLTGRTPFDSKALLAAGLDAMRRVIRETDPPRPSTALSTMLDADLTTVAKRRQAAPPKLIHLVRGDLDWIVMRALEKDRTRRYDTANGLALDVQRYLTDEPVLACPPSNLYRFQKLVLRNKLAFTASLCVAAALVLGLGLSTWQFIEKSRAEREQRRLRQIADREAQHSRQVALILEDMLKSAGPSVALGRDATLLKEILDKTVVRVTTDLKEQPDVEAEICNTIGEVYRALGRFNQAEELHRGARALQEKSAGGKHPDLATSLDDLALVLRDQGRLAEAETLERQALALRRNMLGNDNADTASSLNNLALVLRSRGKLAQAESFHREALAIQERLFGPENMATATSLNNLGLTLAEEGKLDEAENSFYRCLAMEKRFLGEERPEVALSLDNLATVLRRNGKLDQAEPLQLQALAMQKKFFGNESKEVATALNDLAQLLRAQDKLAKAEAMHRDALAMRRKVLHNEHPDVAVSLDNLALVLRDEKHFEDAEAREREALEMRKRLFDEDHPAVARSLNNLALILQARGGLADAESLFHQAVALEKKVHSDADPAVASSLNNLGMLLVEEEKLNEAEDAFREALKIRQKLFGDASPAATNSLYHLALVLEKKRKLSEARAIREDNSSDPPENK